MTSRRTFITAAVFAAALAAAGCDKLLPRPAFKATDVTGAEFGRDFHLTDFNGKPRSLADYKGKIVVVFFGYTQCPDVCPTTLAALREVRERMGPDRDKVQVLFITLDPERDTPQLLSQYVPAFDPTFMGLYGDPATTAQTAKDFKVFYAKNEGKTPTSYTLDHTAAVFIYDTQGRLRLFGGGKYSVEDYLHDLPLLLKAS